MFLIIIIQPGWTHGIKSYIPSPLFAVGAQYIDFCFIFVYFKKIWAHRVVYLCNAFNQRLCGDINVCVVCIIMTAYFVSSHIHVDVEQKRPQLI